MLTARFPCLDLSFSLKLECVILLPIDLSKLVLLAKTRLFCIFKINDVDGMYLLQYTLKIYQVKLNLITRKHFWAMHYIGEF